MQTRTVLFAGDGNHGRRVPLEDRNGKQCRERTGRLDDMPYCDPPMLEEISDKRKLAGRLGGLHVNRGGITDIPFAMMGEVPDTSNRGQAPIEVDWRDYSDVERPDGRENADPLIREAFYAPGQAGYLEIVRRQQSQLGDYQNLVDTWDGGYKEITIAPIVNPQDDLSCATPRPHESDNYQAELPQLAGSSWNHATVTDMLTGVDWESSFAQGRGNRGAPAQGLVGAESPLSDVISGLGTGQRRVAVFAQPVDYYLQETALTSVRPQVDDTAFMRPKSWTRRKSMFGYDSREQALSFAGLSATTQDATLQLAENRPKFDERHGATMSYGHDVGDAWDRFSAVRVLREGKASLPIQENSFVQYPPIYAQAASFAREERTVNQRDSYGSLYDVGMMRSQTVQNPGMPMSESTFQMNVAAKRGLFARSPQMRTEAS
jgi:hypothetical protein